jgi:hypothetical protein
VPHVSFVLRDVGTVSTSRYLHSFALSRGTQFAIQSGERNFPSRRKFQVRGIVDGQVVALGQA